MEYFNCMDYIKDEIKLVNPKFILGFGALTYKAVFPEGNFDSARGHIIKTFAVDSIFTYHPNELITDTSLKRMAWEDLKKIPRLTLDE